MNNALLYCVNNNNKWNKTYLHQMVNSINSFYYHNPKTLLDTITVYILTDKKDGLDLSKLNPDVKYVVIEESELSYDYSTMPKNNYMPHLSYHTYFRFEMFNNPIFNDIDNLMYIDCDTEFNAPIDELFYPKKVGRICMVPENKDLFKNLYNKEGLGAYYNAGMILYTPKSMPKEKSSEMFNMMVELAKKNEFIYSDQCALNFTLKDPRFNRYVMDLGETYNSFLGTWRHGIPETPPKITHHAGNAFAKLYTYKYI